jgi:hypothetical protein
MIPPRISGQQTLRVPTVHRRGVALIPGRISGATTSHPSGIVGKRVEVVARWRQRWMCEMGRTANPAAKHFSAEPRNPRRQRDADA